MYHKKRLAYKIVLVLFIFLQFQYLFLPFSSSFTLPGTSLTVDLSKLSLINPPIIDSAGLSSASATLSNPRLSFHGQVNATIPAGGSIGVVKSSGNNGDLDTRNLFPNDSIVIVSNSAIQVATVSPDLQTFTIKSGLVSQALADTYMTVAQQGTMTVHFYTSAPIPANGSIKISVPAPSSGGNDSKPDTGASISSNGFDTNTMTNANMTCPNGFTAGTFTTGTGGAPHTYTCNYGAASLPAGANLTVVIGNTSKYLINPAPLYTGHTRGLADIYTIAAGTYSTANGGGSLVEDVEAKIAPVEGVLVTATVDETLSFTIAGLAGGTRCNMLSTVTTTATSVPWGVVNSSYSAGRNNAAQQITITTNAASGYNVYAEENDQMGKDGAVCTGAAPSAGEYTFGTSSCIRDYFNATTSHMVATDWGTSPGSSYGFGYALENQNNTDARFVYSSGGSFMAKQFADQEASEDKYGTNADLMYNTGPVSGSSVYVCYRINLIGTQPAGYYFNSLKYTAVAKF